MSILCAALHRLCDWIAPWGAGESQGRAGHRAGVCLSWGALLPPGDAFVRGVVQTQLLGAGRMEQPRLVHTC